MKIALVKAGGFCMDNDTERSCGFIVLAMI
jgi:hypothetical protein